MEDDYYKWEGKRRKTGRDAVMHGKQQWRRRRGGRENECERSEVFCPSGNSVGLQRMPIGVVVKIKRHLLFTLRRFMLLSKERTIQSVT